MIVVIHLLFLQLRWLVRSVMPRFALASVPRSVSTPIETAPRVQPAVWYEARRSAGPLGEAVRTRATSRAASSAVPEDASFASRGARDCHLRAMTVIELTTIGHWPPPAAEPLPDALDPLSLWERGSSTSGSGSAAGGGQ